MLAEGFANFRIFMIRLRVSMSFALRCGASLVRSCCIAVQLQRFLPLAFRSILLAVGACSAICWCTLALVKEGYSTGCSDVCGCAAPSARTRSRVVAWIALKAGRTRLPGKRLRRRLGFRSEAQLCALRFGRGLGRRRPARSRSPLAVGLVPFSCTVDGGSGAHAAVNSFRSGLGCSFGAQCILPELGEDEVWSEVFESGGGSGAGGALAHDAFGGESGAGGALAGAGGGDDMPRVAGDALASAGDALAGPGEGDDVTPGAGGALACAAGDPFRGGAGSSSVTRRKRTEKMLASLTDLLKGWADGEGEAAEETAAEEDGSYEALFTQLEQLIWQRPADPVGALAALLKEWQAPPRKVQVAPRWASRRRPSEDWHDEWTSWAEWDNHWSQDAPRGRWGRKALASWEDSAIDADYAEAGWTEVTRRKRRQKDKQPGAQTPKQPEVAASRGQPAKGKGKGRGAAGGRASWPGAGGDAGAMRAADWFPRAADWTAAGTTVVSTVDEMWEDLTLDYVMCPRSEAELARLRTLVLSSESPPDVTIVLLKSESELEKGRKEFAEAEWAEARIPGTWRGHVRVASTWLAKCSSDAPSLRRPRLHRPHVFYECMPTGFTVSEGLRLGLRSPRIPGLTFGAGLLPPLAASRTLGSGSSLVARVGRKPLWKGSSGCPWLEPLRPFQLPGSAMLVRLGSFPMSVEIRRLLVFPSSLCTGRSGSPPRSGVLIWLGAGAPRKQPISGWLGALSSSAFDESRPRRTWPDRVLSDDCGVHAECHVTGASMRFRSS